MEKSFELIKDQWTEKDKSSFVQYLNSFSKGEEKAMWEKRILNTSYPCNAVPSVEIDRIVREIHKGNFLSFIELFVHDNYACLEITGKLIAKIKDFETMKTYLLKYIKLVDCWAGTDCLKFNVKAENKDKFFTLSKELTKSKLPFERRLGLIILFKLIDDDYIDEIMKICSEFANEDHYYVNMANAWLIAECFAKRRDKTLQLLKSQTLNKFTQNKAISKCRDSFRVSKEDKEMLVSLRIK